MIRECNKYMSLALTTSEGTTPEINYEEFSAGEIFIPTGSSITTLTWWAAARQKSDPTGTVPATAATFLPAQDSAGNAVTQTVAATKCYPIPVALAGCACLKIVVNAAGSVEMTVKT